MTVNFEVPVVKYIGNGTATEYAFLWSMDDANEVFVEQNGLRLEVGVDYDVTNLNLDNGGTIEFYVAPPQDDEILIFRKTPITQQVDYTQAPFPEETHEAQLDKDTRILQEQFTTGGEGDGSVDLEAVPGPNFVDIENTGGLDARIPSWVCTGQLAGAYHGEVVESGQAPVDGTATTKNDGFIWLELEP